MKGSVIMKFYWYKTVGPEDVTAIYNRLFDAYGLDYTGGWYSTSFICNGRMNHTFVVQTESDDPIMLELGFCILKPV